ncbi:hypothetical protein GCM10010446_21940 [Streptomyces enissocaesilis]|uniref:Uncharacterized protein n=1 Tax=Streptomyces enissocaesilis TaxID=332589 RepID=A0ABN3X4G7_9ACTN
MTPGAPVPKARKRSARGYGKRAPARPPPSPTARRPGGPRAPAEPIATATEALGGRIDVLVANHALSGSEGTLATAGAAVLDAHRAVGTRSVALLVQVYARLRATLPRRSPGGRIVRMTSGQDIAGGRPGEVAYGLARGALASATRTLAVTLADLAVTVAAVDPGPVDTGRTSGDDYGAITAVFPAGRWGVPGGPARHLTGHGRGNGVSPARAGSRARGRITGQATGSEGGFRRG